MEAIALLVAGTDSATGPAQRPLNFDLSFGMNVRQNLVLNTVQMLDVPSSLALGL